MVGFPKRFYFDTSALLPYYREEEVSDAVNRFILTLKPPIWVSDLTRVEFVSALNRLVRMNDISEHWAGVLENTFMKEIRAGLFIAHPLKANHYHRAERWLSARTTPLRTLDSLHLACCFSLDAEMITCDRIFHDAATKLGLKSRIIVPGAKKPQ